MLVVRLLIALGIAATKSGKLIEKLVGKTLNLYNIIDVVVYREIFLLLLRRNEDCIVVRIVDITGGFDIKVFIVI